jgi:hypothetical protein
MLLEQREFEQSMTGRDFQNTAGLGPPEKFVLEKAKQVKVIRPSKLRANQPQHVVSQSCLIIRIHTA